MGYEWYWSFENELICRMCGESNHHGYTLDGNPARFICHPCADEVALEECESYQSLSKDEKGV